MTELNNWAGANLGVLIIALAVIAAAALIIALLLAVRLHKVQRHYRVLTQGAEGGNLQEVLEAHAEVVRTTGGQVGELDAIVRRLERDGGTHLQRLGFLRFNPFRDAGGDQSFAVAVADLRGNGVVLSSLHGRDGTRVYGKPLAGWVSPYPLTDEERAAIEKAKTTS